MTSEEYRGRGSTGQQGADPRRRVETGTDEDEEGAGVRYTLLSGLAVTREQNDQKGQYR
jgi:hypothetical protein